jgi:hypothetical protein
VWVYFQQEKIKVDGKKLNKKQHNNVMRVKGFKNIQTATKMVVSLAEQKQSKKVKCIIQNLHTI